MTRCPACSSLLYRRTVEGVEVDGCPGCGGVWLDDGELKRIAAVPQSLRALDRIFVPGAQTTAAQRTGKCPRCEGPLNPIEYEQFRGVRLDKCKACGGVWLDHGEAGAVADKLESPPTASPPEERLELATAPRGPVPAATALVRDVDRGAPEFSGPFWERLHRADSLVLQQQFEVGELLGFETRNKYAIQADGLAFGWAAEQGRSVLDFLFRQILGHWRSFEITLFDQARTPVLRALHPFRFFFQRLQVSLADGTYLGALQQRFAFFSKRFDVEDARGRVILTVRSPFWRLWTFPFLRNEREEVAVVQKRWAGFLNEGLTDKDRFFVKLGPQLSDTERALLLVAGIFIDLQYFENKANR